MSRREDKPATAPSLRTEMAINGAQASSDGGRLSNWGRWGAEDEVGALNLIDAAKVFSALRVPVAGRVYALGHVVGSASSPALEGRRGAIHHYMIRDGGDASLGTFDLDFDYAEDVVSLPIHSSSTHIDALAHGWSKQQMWNGYSSQLVTSRGALRCGIEKMPPIVTRGLLFDVPELTGRPLRENSAIGARELEALAMGLPQIESGDALLLRTGWAGRAELPNDQELRHPGLDESAVEWISRRQFSLVAADTLGAELMPSASGAHSPVHTLLIRNLGIPIMELVNLETLASDHVRVVCLVVAPLRIQGGTGSPVNPVAIA
jgi:Putative cyclase